MRRCLTQLDRTEVRSRAREPICHIWQRFSVIDRYRSRPRPEVERFRLADFLVRRDVLRVEPRDVHEPVVVDEDDVLILMRGSAALVERVVLTVNTGASESVRSAALFVIAPSQDGHILLASLDVDVVTTGNYWPGCPVQSKYYRARQPVIFRLTPQAPFAVHNAVAVDRSHKHRGRAHGR